MNDKMKYLVAKNDIIQKKWLPLWVHSLDTFQVMKYLINYWLSDARVQALSERLSKEEIERVAVFLAIVHDFGKASVTFQSKITEKCDELRTMLHSHGFEVPQMNDPDLHDSHEMPHGVAGEIMLKLRECPDSLAAIIGAHHGKPWDKGEEATEDIEDFLEDGGIEEFYRNSKYSLLICGNKYRRTEWIYAQDEFFNWVLSNVDIKSVNILPSITDSEAILFAGLIIMADWIASNEDLFPLIPYGIYEPISLEQRIENAKKQLNIPPIWNPVRNEDYIKLMQERFGFCPNSVQQEIIKAVFQSEKPGLFILEAPMGVGKTEAALLAAEEFSNEYVGGLMFALPTQATANGIFSRIVEWGKGQTEQNNISIRLAHGLASLNEEYRSLIGEGKTSVTAVDDYDNNSLVVHDFFQGNKQALLADFVVGTIDQILMASLKQKHFMLRHLGLSGKAVIVDECHAYDAYMNEYLERTIEWLGTYNTPVIMLSATLPYERRAALVDAYLGYPDKMKNDKWRKAIGYPLLTWTDKGKVHQKEIEYTGNKRTVIIKKTSYGSNLDNQIEGLSELLHESLNEGGCAGIVVNTVNRAQIIAEKLREVMKDKKIILLHSRFISEDRQEHESNLLKYAGKKSNNSDRNGLIIVGTQVIEQSLDFDVDVMITDLCPMDLLLQRIGRLHRHPHHDKDRPEKLKTAKCFVLGTDEPDKGTIKVYGEYILMRTQAFLPERIELPTDIAPLVQSVYDETCEMGNYPDRYIEAKEQEHLIKKNLQKNADAFRINAPHKYKTINRMLESSILNDEDHAKAQVRNGQMSQEVIVLFESDYGLTRAPWRYNDNLNTELCPSNDVCRRISCQSLRLPSWVSEKVSFDGLSMPKNWNESVWLKNKKLFVFNKDKEMEHESLIFKYSYEKGLTAERRF